MASPDTIVVGGGIAGLSVAWQLAVRGARVLLLEQEPLVGTHSTGRNAAIWLPTELSGTSPALARRSAEMLDALLGRDAWLAETGALVTAPQGEERLLEENVEGARASGAHAERISADDAVRLAPLLRGGSTRAAVYVRDAGVLDIHAMTDAVARAARGAGVSIRASARVERVSRRIVSRSHHVGGVSLVGGEEIDAERVVIAGGAWAAALGASCGAQIECVPLRRHLVVLAAEVSPHEPVVWNVAPDVYYRPESGGVLASPCDEAALDPCVPPVERGELDTLARRLTALAPSLAGARVRRAWACLRTYTPDRELIAGPDPRLPGLGWLAGLGGRGMTVGLAAGELAASLLDGEPSPFERFVSPTR